MFTDLRLEYPDAERDNVLILLGLHNSTDTSWRNVRQVWGPYPHPAVCWYQFCVDSADTVWGLLCKYVSTRIAGHGLLLIISSAGRHDASPE